MRGFVRPCQPIRARARAGLFGCDGLVVVAEVATAGGGLVKKSGGRLERTASRSRDSGRRRLNSYGRKSLRAQSSSYRERRFSIAVFG